MIIYRGKIAALGLLILCLMGSEFASAQQRPPRENRGNQPPADNDNNGRNGNRGVPDPLEDADYYENNEHPEDKVILGNLLFYDKILSGNMNISCATCHHAMADTGDGLSLSAGEGGMGLGITRALGVGDDAVHERIPRNAPALFAVGATEFDTIFHDGRIQRDDTMPSGIASPAGTDLPEGLDNVLAAQALFPLTSGAEMAGQASENPIGTAAANGDLAGPNGVWQLITERLRANAAYVDLFQAAYDDVSVAGDITIVHAANAIAAFEASSWPSNNSPFDRFLRGDNSALSNLERQGMRLFYGRARCSTCHSGPLLSDFDFHAIAMPQIGPGKGVGVNGHEDFGRELVTGDPDHRYEFRTPPLRNVALTAPYGHSGAYDTLEAIVTHYTDPEGSLRNYDRDNFVAPSREDLDAIDFAVMDNPELVDEIADANFLRRGILQEEDVPAVVAFLKSLTDPDNLDLRHNVPSEVPSGLPVFD